MNQGKRYKATLNQSDDPCIIEASNHQVSISVPIKLKRRSGRRLITLPDGSTSEQRPWDTEPTPLQLALARGHRWLAMLESDQATSLREIATKEGVDNSHVSRMVNLTTLAPDIVEAILDDLVPPELTLFGLAVDPPRLWSAQRQRLNAASWGF